MPVKGCSAMSANRASIFNCICLLPFFFQ